MSIYNNPNQTYDYPAGYPPGHPKNINNFPTQTNQHQYSVAPSPYSQNQSHIPIINSPPPYPQNQSFTTPQYPQNQYPVNSLSPVIPVIPIVPIITNQYPLNQYPLNQLQLPLLNQYTLPQYNQYSEYVQYSVTPPINTTYLTTTIIPSNYTTTTYYGLPQPLNNNM